jgi:hypothetical protein
MSSQDMKIEFGTEVVIHCWLLRPVDSLVVVIGECEFSVES